MVDQNIYSVDDAMRIGVPNRACPHYYKVNPDGSVTAKTKGIEGKCIEVEFFPLSKCSDTIGESGMGDFRDYVFITGDYKHPIGQDLCFVESRNGIFVNTPQKYYFPVETCRIAELPKKRKNQWRMICKVNDVDTEIKLPFIVQGNIVPKLDANGNMIGLRYSSGKAPIYHTKAKIIKSVPVQPQPVAQPQQNIAVP